MEERMSSASRPFDSEGRVYHLGLRKGDVPKYVLMPGEVERASRIASSWDRSWRLAQRREYSSFRGVYRGVDVAVVSTGIGGPATAIAVEELLELGADTLIRVGSTGAIQDDIEVGDIIITTAAVRMDGTSYQYAPAGYPASASYEVIMALVEAAEGLGVRYHLGITASTDSFYVGQGRPGYGGYMPSWSRNLMPDLRQMRVLNFEMESATLLTLANIYGFRAGAVHAVYAQRVKDEFVAHAGDENLIKVADEAVRILHEWDEVKGRAGKRYLYPSLLRSSP
ncbi:uridine phosphorylase [Acidilobus sp.]|uniref:uridine phosphorylase n=1 Tax=Acidilobus sp. TaxID=1872109 RepID=UPI003D0474B7